MDSPELLESLKEYATPKQLEKLQALIDHGTHRAAAESLGCSKNSVGQAITAVKIKASAAGFAPEAALNHPVPAGFSIDKISTMEVEGNKRVEWVSKSIKKEDRELAIKAFTDALVSDVQGLHKPTPAPPNLLDDMLVVIPLPEPHIGMQAWGKESGDDYDCAIAERVVVESISALIKSAPGARHCMISSIGDWLHIDNMDSTTPRGGNNLDQDNRWGKVVETAERIFIKCIDLALEKFEVVHVKGVPGNHDELLSHVMSRIMNAYFHDNPRVIVDLGVGTFKYHRFGKNLLGFYHGHTVKHELLPNIMANDVPEDWGATTERMWITGHIHHLVRKEFPGVVVESFRSVAAKDSWHASHGYRARRDMQLLVFHKTRGLEMRMVKKV